MCGISGFNWQEEKIIGKMNDVNRYRGPDDTGIFSDKQVTLGHTRLSILDLSPDGHQPMCNESKTLWITYNGEVYNYREIRKELEKKGYSFKSDSDTEVVLKAYEEYGLECLNQFNGMWGFCIYDTIKNELFLARDRYGIKPLYYYYDGKRLIFSSMIRAILQHDIDVLPNDEAIFSYLAYNLEDHTENTFFTGISLVPSGSYMIYNLKTSKIQKERYYNLNSENNDNPDNINRIRELFIDSVRSRTVSDVPVGSCLSGGVDSSSIVCCLDNILNEEFSTYSLVVPGHVHDESKYILEVGKRTHTSQYFTEIIVEDFISEFQDFVLALEEPVTSLSPYGQYRVMKLAHSCGAKVLLDGQGGDEVFAGYVYYFAYYYTELLKKMQILTLCKEIKDYKKYFGNLYSLKMLLYICLPEQLKFSLKKNLHNHWINYKYFTDKNIKSFDPRLKCMNLNKALKLTLCSTAIPHLLRWEDKNAMRWSIESRVPFLDYLLVEAAFSLNPKDKIEAGETKKIFKDAMKGILPDMIHARKDKIGFFTPMDELFRDKRIQKYTLDILLSPECKNRSYWNHDDIIAMFHDHVKGTQNYGQTLWKVISLEHWFKAYFEDTKDLSYVEAGSDGIADYRGYKKYV